MQPTVNSTEFGSITIGGQVYNHDVQIGLNGAVIKRKKELSQSVYGTSHMVSLDEAQHIYDNGARRLIIGSGQYGKLGLSAEAEKFFKDHGCDIELHPTPEAIECWNEAHGEAIGMFHITC